MKIFDSIHRSNVRPKTGAQIIDKQNPFE